MNLLGLQQESGRLLGDPNNDKWSAATLTTRINLAQTEIQGYTNAIKTNETLTAASSVGLNANTMNVLRVNVTDTGGNTYPLQGVSIQELAFRYPDYAQFSAGRPLLYLYDGTAQTIQLYPPPDSNWTVASGMGVVESRKPTDLANSTDVPFDSNNQLIPYHMAIVHWVVAHCFMDDGTPEALGKAKFHRSGNMLNPGEYEKELGRIIAEFDDPEGVPGSILWRPAGGRVGTWYIPSKSNPMGWGGW